LKQEEILDIFTRTGALLEGHFLLTSGLHSPQYFQCALVLQYPQYGELLCRQIAGHFSNKAIDLVIAPAIGGILVSYEVGRFLNCRAIFAEREGEVMRLRRGFKINPGERVLVVEDVVTTGGSVKEVIELVRKAEAKVVGVGFIVDRSGGEVDFGVEKYSLLQLKVVTYKPEECPLCKEGLPVVKPGSRKTP